MFFQNMYFDFCFAANRQKSEKILQLKATVQALISISHKVIDLNPSCPAQIQKPFRLLSLNPHPDITFSKPRPLFHRCLLTFQNDFQDHALYVHFFRRIQWNLQSFPTNLKFPTKCQQSNFFLFVA